MIFKYEVLKQTRSEVTNPVPKATRVQNWIQNIRRKYGDSGAQKKYHAT